MSIGTCKFWHTVVLFFCMCKVKNHRTLTRGSQEPVIAHLVFNLTSKVDRKWGRYT
jgi:hypothetical protein